MQRVTNFTYIIPMCWKAQVYYPRHCTTPLFLSMLLLADWSDKPPLHMQEVCPLQSHIFKNANKIVLGPDGVLQKYKKGFGVSPKGPPTKQSTHH